MEYLLSCVIGYFLGSIPTAYLILKKSKGIDITTKGSGNVGAMNFYEVTNSKKLGIIVFIVDFLKGLASVSFILFIVDFSFLPASLSLLFAVFSHCFNPWINFKGGRGLATAAGGLSILYPVLLFAWLVLWVIVYLLKKDILIANISATILSLCSVFATYQVTIKYAFPEPTIMNELLLFSSALLIIIFIKHIEPLKEIISKTKTE